jgi:hypothetical protein
MRGGPGSGRNELRAGDAQQSRAALLRPAGDSARIGDRWRAPRKRIGRLEGSGSSRRAQAPHITCGPFAADPTLIRGDSTMPYFLT